MKVEIWSDIMCPFCYIGKRNYESALAQTGFADEIQTEWHSFQLDPSLPETAMPAGNIYQYLAERKGMDIATARRMHDELTLRAAESGLTYNFDRSVIANSFKAHTLIQFAKTKGLDDATEEALFKAYFTDGKDVSDTATLVALAVEAGLDANEAAAALEDDTYRYAVSQDLAEARQIGISGVPFFVLNRRYAVSGAQPADSFAAALEKSYREWKDSGA